MSVIDDMLKEASILVLLFKDMLEIQNFEFKIQFYYNRMAFVI